MLEGSGVRRHVWWIDGLDNEIGNGPIPVGAGNQDRVGREVRVGKELAEVVGNESVCCYVDEACLIWVEGDFKVKVVRVVSWPWTGIVS